ncbi:MAG TPA: hypothetical protein VKZ51_10330, partial [Cyclobacteriaceae bacterium]|nr:hypothetical protein [Cyclobacteriaceae bacterium]
KEKIKAWVGSGGKLIAIKGALEFFTDKEGFALSRYSSKEEKKAREEREKKQDREALTIPYQERERQAISGQVLGAVFEVVMDTTHALGFGTKGKYYALKQNEKRYGYLKEGVNAGIIPSMDQHRTGFIGYKAKLDIDNSLAFGIEVQEKGKIIYMVDNPIFRGFWEGGKLVLANAIFLVQ